MEIRFEGQENGPLGGACRRFRSFGQRRKDVAWFGYSETRWDSRRGGPSQWIIAPANVPFKPGEGVLNISGMEVRVDPLAEWKQMYHEVWRIERGYFYDANLHGLDAAAAEKEYEPYVASLTSRDDLNYIFQEMLSEITASHLRGGGGTVPRGKRVTGGLLGADFEIADAHYPLPEGLYGR